MRTIHKVVLAIFAWIGVAVLLLITLGSEGKNEEFKPQEEYRLEPWVHIEVAGIDVSITRAVFYLFLASALTILTMTWIARRMQAKPNRVQTAVEAAYILMRDNITKGNMDSKMASRWFSFVGALFLFVWFSNFIGYIPLPTNTHETVDVLGAEVPTFAIYAATANISVPLVLTLFVWFAYHVEGIRAQGVRGYFRSWVPAGVEGFAAGPIFVIEVISHFVRVISLSVRLFANILAGHLLILFMGGGLAVLLGLAAIGWLTLPMAVAFFIFELALIVTLQAFIFATLTSIYFGGATAAHH